MDAITAGSVSEERFNELLGQEPLPVQDLLALVGEAAKDAATAKNADKWSRKLADKAAASGDFDVLYTVVKDRAASLRQPFGGSGIGELLAKHCKDRLQKAMLEVAAFDQTGVSLEESFRRFDKLRSFQKGTAVIDRAWGFGIVARVDDFYKRITVDFTKKKNHALSFRTACDTLNKAGDQHFWTILNQHPEQIAEKIEKKPEELVRIVLRSFGAMPVQKLQEILENSKVLPAGWKSFWERARAAMKASGTYAIPTKRSDNIVLNVKEEKFDDDYFKTLSKNKNPEQILNAVKLLESKGKLEGLTDANRAVLQNRLSFVLKGAQKVDIPLYARCACTIDFLKLPEPPLEEMLQNLWEENACLSAAYKMKVGDVKEMTALLLKGDGAAAKLLEALSYRDEEHDPEHPQMAKAMVEYVLDVLQNTPECEEQVFKLLNKPKAPFAILIWVFVHRKALKDIWKKQIPFIRLLDHAVALIELTAAGEALKAQNQMEKMMESEAWWQDTLADLPPVQRRLLFERIQASAEIDSTTQRKFLEHMIKVDPELKTFKKTVIRAEKTVQHLTSFRSWKKREADFKRLVNVEIPANRRAIQEAKEKGDLSENAEYQYAKDKERELLARQSELNKQLDAVKPSDYAKMPTDKVGPGTTVVLDVAGIGEETYTILGEWDYDEDLHIISNLARLAKAIEGRKPGDVVPIPRPNGDVNATVKSISPLSETVAAWIKAVPSAE